MKFLVLGANGFIGKHLCEKIVKNGNSVRAFIKSNSVGSSFFVNNPSVECVKGNFLNATDFDYAVNGIDIIYHLISTTLPQSSNQDMKYDISSNVLSTISLLEAAKKNNVKKIVFFSSGGTVYGKTEVVPVAEDHPTEPICSYGIQKLMIEKYLQLHHYLYELDFNVLRISNPYGSGQSFLKKQGIIPIFLNKVIKGEEIEIWGDGSTIRDYIHVDDVVEAAVKASCYDGTEKVFNIGSGKGYSINEVVQKIEDIVGLKANVRYKVARQVDVPVNILDITRAQEKLRWKPEVDLGSGILNLYENLEIQKV